MKIETVWGCASDGQPLLTRYHLWETKWFRLCLHVFHRSDIDRAYHDHPWPFISWILWGGYTESRPNKLYRKFLKTLPHGAGVFLRHTELANWHSETKKYFPGMILFRPAWWAHRIVLPPGKKSISLVLMGKKERDWGFFGIKGWQHWKIFTTGPDCG